MQTTLNRFPLLVCLKKEQAGLSMLTKTQKEIILSFRKHKPGG